MRTTLYMVQLFTRKGRKLATDPPLTFKSEDEAIARAERGMKTKAGVLVTRIEGDPDADDWDEPAVLLRAGELPRALAEED
jgi:hypothetical protein